MTGYWQNESDKYLVEKAERYRRERDAHLDDLIAYREWFLMNETKLKEVAITAPPYTKKEQDRLVALLHAKYCPNCLVDE